MNGRPELGNLNQSPREMMLLLGREVKDFRECVESELGEVKSDVKEVKGKVDIHDGWLSQDPGIVPFFQKGQRFFRWMLGLVAVAVAAGVTSTVQTWLRSGDVNDVAAQQNELNEQFVGFMAQQNAISARLVDIAEGVNEAKDAAEQAQTAAEAQKRVVIQVQPAPTPKPAPPPKPPEKRKGLFR